MKYVFGPLKSRRLGNSLGINLLPYKICSFDCVYCQLGPTKDKSVRREEFSNIPRLIQELKTALQDSNIDYVTFAGLGEPTLISNLGEIISQVKAISSKPIAVITNGSLLADKAVRHSLLKADVVLPSLDTADEAIFKKIDRPHPSLNLENIVKGLISFRQEFKGKIWLEIMLMQESMVDAGHLKKFKEITERIRPDKIHLVNPIRSGGKDISLMDKEKLLEIQKVLGPNCFIV